MEITYLELLARNDLQLVQVVKNHLEGKIISLINKIVRKAQFGCTVIKLQNKTKNHEKSN